ncbi:MAG TPA: flagellar motor switch protein FliM [Nocardioidaceae bacterium]|nr:flagellar motor switch protein FliM [Nocardioidaceae bacterium]
MTVSSSARPARVIASAAHGRRRPARKEPTPYDFRRPVKLSRENSRALQIAFETFARQASTVMTSALRSVCQFTLVSGEQLTYTEYVDSLPDPSYLTLFTLDPIQQPAILQLPLAATMACVDHLLGGPGTPDQPERPLTDLESSVIGGLFERLVAEVRYAFASLVPVTPEIVGVEYSPQLAQVAAAADTMVVARMILQQGEVEHDVSLCLSFNALAPYINSSAADIVSDRDRAQRAEASARLAAGFQDVPIEVGVRFRATAADPVELSTLAVGDVVRLRHPAEAPLDVMAADVVFAHATPGSHGDRLACLIVAPPTSSASQQHQES